MLQDKIPSYGLHYGDALLSTNDFVGAALGVGDWLADLVAALSHPRDKADDGEVEVRASNRIKALLLMRGVVSQ